MLRRTLPLVALAFGLGAVRPQQVAPAPAPASVLPAAAEAIRAQALLAHAGFLAADELRGRETASREQEIVARYVATRGSAYTATVRGLRGVMAHARSLEACRSQVVEVVEEWVLVRVARGLPVPRLAKAQIRVRRVR